MNKKLLLFLFLISCILLLDNIKADECPQIDGNSGTNYKFNTMGGNNIDNIHVCNTCADALKLGEIELPTPIKEGYKFLGWYIDSDFSTQISSLDDSNIIFKFSPNECSSREATLFAKWEKIENANDNVDVNNVNVDNTLKNTEICGIIFAIVLIISGIVFYKYSLKTVRQNKN